MFSNPLKNLKTLELRENDIVADLGAGTGYYSVVAGALVPKGKVYAVELQKDFLETIRRKVKEANLHNVECLYGNVEKLGGTKIGDKIIDAAIVSNILSQVEDKEKFVGEVRRILKPKGRVLLVDWSEKSIMHRYAIMRKTEARAIFEKAGFVFGREIDAGSHHYGMILTRS